LTGVHFYALANIDSWLIVDENSSISEQEFLNNLFLNREDHSAFTFHQISEHQDNFMSHKRFLIRYKGIKIFGESLRVHSENGMVYLANGEILKSNISDLYFSSEPEHYKSYKLNELFWIRDSKNKNQFHLCYKEISNNYEQFYTVNTSEKTASFSLFSGCDSITSRTHLPYQYGIQELNVVEGIDKFYLIDECRNSRPHSIKTMKGNGANPVEIFYSTNNSWDNQLLSSAAQCHWASSQFYDFLYSSLNRNSYDAKGAEMIVVLDTSLKNGAGFAYNGMYALIGVQANNLNQSWASMDIISHEWTHPIIFTENILLWNNEGRAIAEGICDAFGTMGEFYAESKFDSLKNGDWTIGEDVFGQHLRSLEDPLSVGISDTYNSSLYLSASSKYERSGPFAHWFYLISEGGQGVNDHNSNPYTYNLSGIGKEKALKIVYGAMLNYLTDQSDYADTRIATQEAAKDLFGECSDEHKFTIEAWKAVGVYDSLRYCKSSSLAQNSDLEISVFPNPSNGIFTFSFPSKSKYQLLQLYNANGQLIDEIFLDESEFTLDLRTMSDGVYFYRLENSENVNFGKLIKN
jgi:Zn-dependent metalloprotease